MPSTANKREFTMGKVNSIGSENLDDIDSKELLRRHLCREYPDETDKGIETMVWLCETYLELPERLRTKMHRFMLMLANNNRRAMKLAERAAEGQITFRQMLETL
jgi:hypothetical protein